MLVPGHVCSLYVATGGANGPALGSDEKEIVMLEYTVIDVLSNEVSLLCSFSLLLQNLTKIDLNLKYENKNTLISCAEVHFFEYTFWIK